MSAPSRGLKSDLKRVRGLGSAKSGTQHFWHQRLTAFANIPLALVTLWVVLSSLGGGYDAAVACLASPLIGPFVLLFVLSAYYHASLGLSNVIEDYVSGEMPRMVALILMRFALILLGVMSIIALLQIMIAG